MTVHTLIKGGSLAENHRVVRDRPFAEGVLEDRMVGAANRGHNLNRVLRCTTRLGSTCNDDRRDQ